MANDKEKNFIELIQVQQVLLECVMIVASFKSIESDVVFYKEKLKDVTAKLVDYVTKE